MITSTLAFVAAVLAVAGIGALTACLLNAAGRKMTFHGAAGIALAAVALFFLRNFYVAVPPLAMLMTRLRAKRGGRLRRLLIRATALAGLAVALMLVGDSATKRPLNT